MKLVNILFGDKYDIYDAALFSVPGNWVMVEKFREFKMQQTAHPTSPCFTDWLLLNAAKYVYAEVFCPPQP